MLRALLLFWSKGYRWTQGWAGLSILNLVPTEPVVLENTQFSHFYFSHWQEDPLAGRLTLRAT